MDFVGDVEFWLYVHGPGEEFYLHYDYWPTVPKIHHARRPEINLDLVVKKMTEISEDNCISDFDSYFGK